MAKRRSAARSARLEAGSFEETTFAVLACAALLAIRLLAGLDGRERVMCFFIIDYI